MPPFPSISTQHPPRPNHELQPPRSSPFECNTLFCPPSNKHHQRPHSPAHRPPCVHTQNTPLAFPSSSRRHLPAHHSSSPKPTQRRELKRTHPTPVSRTHSLGQSSLSRAPYSMYCEPRLPAARQTQQVDRSIQQSSSEREAAERGRRRERESMATSTKARARTPAITNPDYSTAQHRTHRQREPSWKSSVCREASTRALFSGRARACSVAKSVRIPQAAVQYRKLLLLLLLPLQNPSIHPSMHLLHLYTNIYTRKSL